MSQNFFYPPSGSNSSVSTLGNPIPSTATLVAGEDNSGNLAPLTLDGSGNLNVVGTVVGPTGDLATETTLEKLTIPQGTALGSNTMAMAGASVTASDPSYTSGQIRPLSLTTTGYLRTDSSGAIQPVSQSGPWPVQVQDGSGNPISSSTGYLDVYIQGSASIPVLATQNSEWDITNITGTVSLPTDASTESTLVLLTNSQGSTTSGQSGPLVQGATTTAAPTYTTGHTNPLSLTTAGALRVDASGSTQPVSGTVTANIGTTGGLALDTTLAKLTIAQGTALGSNTQALSGGSVTTAAPTYTTGQISPISLTTAGALRTDSSGTTQPVSGTVTANIGTTNGLALDATVTKLTIAQGTALGSNTQALMGGSVTTAAPTYTTGQISPMSLTTAGAVRTDSSGTTQPVSGTVTANIGTTNGLALDATLAKLNVSQGTALGSNTGPMIQGSVTTAAPTYTTGQISPVSLTTAGAVRVDGSGVTQPVSGTVSTITGAFTKSEFVRNDYSSVNVTTGAYVQLIASTSNAYQQIMIQDTSGQTLKLATGGSGSEVDILIIPQGGTYPISFAIPISTRISIRAISGTANTGEIDLQLLG